MKEYLGTVIHGEKRGHQIGFPTANIDLQNLEIEVEPGVYSAKVRNNKRGEDQWYKAILFFGPKKTFGKVENTLEIHILDFNQDIYDQQITFTIGKFIRGPKKFNSVGELKGQIKKDISKVA